MGPGQVRRGAAAAVWTVWTVGLCFSQLVPRCPLAGDPVDGRVLRRRSVSVSACAAAADCMAHTAQRDQPVHCIAAHAA